MRRPRPSATPHHPLADFLGWYGALAVLLGFFLLGRGSLSPNSGWYIFLNVTGAIGLIAEGSTKRDYPTTALNAAWLLIAILSLFRSGR